mgnify:CR=1 FL=1
MNAPTMNRSLIAPTSNALLERALLDKLARRAERTGSLGGLEPLAVRIGLMQNTLKPRLRDPQLLVYVVVDNPTRGSSGSSVVASSRCSPATPTSRTS